MTKQETTEFIFPALEEIESFDMRFDGKLGKFKLGEDVLLEGNKISFALISQAYCFGDLGKLAKNVEFQSLVLYALSGSFGRRMIRLFVKGDSLTAFKNTIEAMFYKSINPYESVFSFEIKGKIKGEHSVYSLLPEYLIDKTTVATTQTLMGCLPSYDYFNNLPYLDRTKHDAIVLWQTAFEEDTNGVMQLTRKLNYPEGAYKEALNLIREKRLAKVDAARREAGQLSAARAIAQKYLSAS